MERGDGAAALGAGGRELLHLQERRGARRDRDAADLFHFALLLPSRAALGRELQHLLERDVKLTGAADHHVSEALYLDDPHGHCIELYRDRPRADWLVEGRITLTNSRLDHEGILAAGRKSGEAWAGLAPGTVMGHVHLQTHDLAAARRFYLERLGLDLVQSDAHVAFMSRAGYHHHVAVNNWNRKRRPAAPEAGGIGLLWYEIRVPEAAIADLAQTVSDGQIVDGVLSARDPSGIPLRFLSAQV
jgi:catechol 2,3-dioxygenase